MVSGQWLVSVLEVSVVSGQWFVVRVPPSGIRTCPEGAIALSPGF